MVFCQFGVYANLERGRSAKKGTVHLVATEEEVGDGQEKLACTRNNAGRTFECRMMGPNADFSGPLSIQPEDV
jgi:hypothetical protein